MSNKVKELAMVRTYQVSGKISVDASGQTVYLDTREVTVEHDPFDARRGYAANGSDYCEVDAVDAAKIKDGSAILVRQGGARSLVELYVRDGHGEGQLASVVLYHVMSHGKQFGGRVRLYGHNLCVVPQASREENRAKETDSRNARKQARDFGLQMLGLRE